MCFVACRIFPQSSTVRSEGIFVNSKGGKQRLLHRLNFLTICYGFYKVFVDNQVNFMNRVSSQDSRLIHDKRVPSIVTSQCHLTFSPFFVFFLGMGKFRGSKFYNYNVFLKDIKTIEFSALGRKPRRIGLIAKI